MNETRKPALLYALAVVIFLEGAALAAATVYLVVEIFVGDPQSVTTAIAYAVTAAIVAALVLLVGRATLSGRPWIRGATVCIAVLQLLVAYSILISGQSDAGLGWVLAAPAIALLVLLFTRPVLRATARPSGDEERTF